MNCKYFTYRKMVSYDNGNTWSPTSEVHRGMLIERDSVDCGGGYEAIYKWVVVEGDYTCQGTDKYEKTEKYVSYDNGETWEIAHPIEYGIGDLIEAQSSDCGYVPPTPANYKLQATYSDSSTYELPCDSTSAITSGEVSTHTTSRSAMTSAIVGDCVNTIGDNAFAGCHSLTSITIPNAVTSIGLAAFNVCSGLTSINIPSGVTVIRQATFALCRSLTSITIPNAVTSIENIAFNACTSFTSIDIPSGVTSIGDSAFYLCRSLTSITINTTTPPTLGSSAFTYTNDCPIYVPCASVDTYKAASGWSEYASRIQGIPPCEEPVPQYRTISGDPYCSGASGYDKYVDVYSQVSYDEGVTWETTATTPTLVEAQSEDCGYIEPQYRTTSGTPYCSGASGYDKYVDVYSQVSYDSGVTWQTTATTPTLVEAQSADCGYVPPTTNYKLQTVRSGGAEYNLECDSTSAITKENSHLDTESAIIGDCVISIGDAAFSGRTSLSSCTIGNNVTSIGANAFWACELRSITIPNGVTSIGAYAFGGCNELTSINIPSGLTTIRAATFYDCDSLPSITIPNSVTSIGNSAFRDCHSLANVTIPSGVTSISDGTFADCHSLSSITIPSGVTSIGGSTFLRCSGLTSIEMPNGITSIGDGAFRDCHSLANVTIPSGVTSIGLYTFADCRSFTSINIPSAVTLIGSSAFNGCTSLTSITVNATTPPTLDGYHIFDNTNNCPIYVPCASIDAYKAASGWSSYASRIQGIPPCGTQFRTTSGTPYCSGETGYYKYVDVYSQVSYDSGTTWETTATTPTLVESQSADCGYGTTFFLGITKEQVASSNVIYPRLSVSGDNGFVGEGTYTPPIVSNILIKYIPSRPNAAAGAILLFDSMNSFSIKQDSTTITTVDGISYTIKVTHRGFKGYVYWG